MASGVFEGASMTDAGTYATVGRTRIVEYLLRTNGKGEMVSMLGPCLCGAGKKTWHTICLKEKSNE